MATIKETNGRFSVKVRKNHTNIGRTFGDLETAQLWGKYKESLTEEIAAFEVGSNKLLTVKDAIELKVTDCINQGLAERSVQDIKNLQYDFSLLVEKNICEISYDEFLKFALSMLKTPITKSKSKDKSEGFKSKPSKITIVNKFRRLSSVYTLLIEKGIDVNNHPLKVATYILKNELS